VLVSGERFTEAVAVVEDLLAAGASAIPVAGGPIAGIAQAITNHKLRKQLAFLDALYDELSERVEALEHIIRDAAHGEVLLEAIDEASTVAEGEPLTLLVRIVADGLQTSDPSDLRRLRLFMDVISQLRPEHIRLLRELGTVANAPGVTVLYMARKWSIYALERRLPQLSAAIDPLIARVVSLGLAYQTGTLSVATPGRPAPQPEWGLSKFGLNLIGYLYESDDSFPPILGPDDLQGST
jgi:hypothetical protein